MAQNLIKITKQGLEKRQSELDELVNVKLPEILDRLEEARSKGDLSENFEYTTARNDQYQTEMRIAQLKNIIQNHQIIKSKDIKVRFVETGRERLFHVVGSIDANTEEQQISEECPLCKALKGKKPNPDEEITYISESGKRVSIIFLEEKESL